MKRFLLSLIITSNLTKIAYSKNSRSSLRPDPLEYVYPPVPDTDQQTNVEYFPEIEYPSSILEREPFFFKSHNPDLDAFSDDVKSNFKYISAAKKIKYNEAVEANEAISSKRKADDDLNKYHGSESSSIVTNFTYEGNFNKMIQEKNQDSLIEVSELDSEIEKQLSSNKSEVVSDKQPSVSDGNETIKTDLNKSDESSNKTIDLAKENLNQNMQDNNMANLTDVTGEAYEEAVDLENDEIQYYNDDNIKQPPSDYFLSEVLMYVTNEMTTINKPKTFEVNNTETFNYEGIPSHSIEEQIYFTIILNDTEKSEIEQAYVPENFKYKDTDVEIENVNSPTASAIPVKSYTSSEDDPEFEDQIPATALLKESEIPYESQVGTFA